MLLHMYVVDDCLDVKNRQMSVNMVIHDDDDAYMIFVATGVTDGRINFLLTA